MANYRCNAACRHCLYACSPDRAEGYIDKDTVESVCNLLLEGGCRSVHIGGGEPFLDFGGLIMLVQKLIQNGISVDYIETNAYWAADRNQAKNQLRELQRAGADTLCISLDPYHAEYVPVDLPLTLAEICQSVDFGYFIWQERFLNIMSRVDKSKTHTREELEQLISPDYIYSTARSYGIHPSGRAIGIEAEYVPNKPIETILNTRPCINLLSGEHFHVDMFGNFIPPGCTGIVIPLSDAVNGIPDRKYPVFEALLNGGNKALLQYATELGFSPEPNGYPSGCALCFHIRCWLSKNALSPELDADYYTEAIK